MFAGVLQGLQALCRVWFRQTLMISGVLAGLRGLGRHNMCMRGAGFLFYNIFFLSCMRCGSKPCKPCIMFFYQTLKLCTYPAPTLQTLQDLTKEIIMKEIRDIEWLVNWAFENQRVESAVKKQTPKAPTISQTGMLQLLELGVRVDVSSQGERWGSARCNDDAVIIYELVHLLPKEAMALVVLHGRAGTRPDWCEVGIGCEEPVLDGRGRQKKIWRDTFNRTGLLGVKTKWVGYRQEQIDFHRAQYSVWYLALEALVIPANKEMIGFKALMPRCAKTPWEFAKRKKIRVPA